MNQLLLRDLQELPSGRVKATDLLDLLAPHIRDFDVEALCPIRPCESDILAPSGVSTAPHGSLRRLTNGFLVPNDTPPVEQLIKAIPNPYLEPFRYLQREYGIDIPVGMEELGIFMVLAFQADPAALKQTTIEHVIYHNSGTVSWTKPTGAALRYTSIFLLGAGSGGGGGSRSSTSGNDASGGGGGASGGYIGRIVNLASLSTGNVVVGSGGAIGTGATGANNNGGNGGNGGNTTFAGLTAGGGQHNTNGGVQGTGAQVSPTGLGGTGDIVGRAGGAGRSGATTGTDGEDATTGPLGGGGGGGGGANANASEGSGGNDGYGYHGLGLKGTQGTDGGGAPRTNGTNSLGGAGAGGCGGGGSNGVTINAGTGSQGGGNNSSTSGYGAGGGGGGGAANTVTPGNGGAGGGGRNGVADILTF